MHRPDRNPWETWDQNIPPPFHPVPLMSLPPMPIYPVPAIPPLRPPFHIGNPFNTFEHGLNPNLKASYETLGSQFFIDQVPPPCLPKLCLPPLRGQPTYNPYNTTHFVARFSLLFETMLGDNFTFGGKRMTNDVARAVSKFRSLPLNEQLDQFLYARTLSAEQVRIRWQIVLDIIFLLRQEFPQCEAYAFGSLLSGFSDGSSDIDIYVDLLGPNKEPFLQSEALQSVKRALNKAQCPHTGCSFFNGRIIPIPRARIPILTIEHLPSSISFDLSFANRISTQNSKLVVLYTNMDPRVFRFMVLMRYWLKFHHLCGARDIKNYALVLLGIVYLVQKGIIPSIHLLQKLKKEQRDAEGSSINSDEIDGWDASFCDDLNIIGQHFQSTCPVPSDFHENPCPHLLLMVLEFCKMFAHVDFGAVVVCPLIGEMILKAGFLPGNDVFLTDMLSRYKSFSQKSSTKVRLKVKTPLCIQDPFVLSFNVTSGAPLGSIIKFQIACTKTAEALANKLEKNETCSLLDMFIPLSCHLNIRDLQKVYRGLVKKRRFLWEIGKAVGIAAMEKYSEKTDSCTQLPHHLEILQGLMDSKNYQMWLLEQAAFEIVETSLSPNFSTLFFDEVEKCGLMKSGSKDTNIELIRITRKLVALWRQFAMDYIKLFFEEALKLKAVGTLREATTQAEDLSMDALYGLNVPAPWKVGAFGKPRKGGAGGRTKEQKERFQKKVEEIQIVSAPNETYFRMMTIEVTYPFWGSRPNRLMEWKGNEKKIISKHGQTEYKENPIHVEGLISDWVLENFLRGGKGDERKDGGVSGKDDAADGMEDEGVGASSGDAVQESVVEVGPQSKRKRVRLDNTKTFDPFSMDVLVKITSKVGDGDINNAGELIDSLERPMIALIFQKDTSNGNSKAATSKLSAFFSHLFPEYQLYRMREWLAQDLDEPMDFQKQPIKL